MYYTYLLRCMDGSLYAGITTDLHRRFMEHSGKGKEKRKGARYTRAHGAKEMVAAWSSENRSTASILEYYLKHLGKKEKETLVSGAYALDAREGKLCLLCHKEQSRHKNLSPYLRLTDEELIHILFPRV